MKTLNSETLQVDLALFQTYLNLSELVHSGTNRVLFEELATDEYELDMTQLTVPQARMYHSLIEVAGRFLETTAANPSIGRAFPEAVAKGMERIYYRLSPVKTLLDSIIRGVATESDLEYYQMKQGLRGHNRQRQANRAA